jgi:hypothetical protein
MRTTTKWVVFNPSTGKRIKTITIKHKNNLLYNELDPFDADLKCKGLAAQSWESLQQPFLKGMSFKERLICLGWEL